MLGARCIDGVVMAVEKLVVSKLLLSGTGKRIFTVDRHAGFAIAGLIPDGRQLASVARDECKQYSDLWGSPVPAKVLSGRVSTWAHAHTTTGYYRPFGCNALIAVMTEAEGPQLWMVEPSGMSYSYLGCAVGKGRQVAKVYLEKLDFSTLTCRQAVTELARIIYKCHEDPSGKPFELEMSWVCTESGGAHCSIPADIQSAAEAAAKAALEAEEEGAD